MLELPCTVGITLTRLVAAEPWPTPLISRRRNTPHRWRSTHTARRSWTLSGAMTCDRCLSGALPLPFVSRLPACGRIGGATTGAPQITCTPRPAGGPRAHCAPPGWQLVGLGQEAGLFSAHFSKPAGATQPALWAPPLGGCVDDGVRVAPLAQSGRRSEPRDSVGSDWNCRRNSSICQMWP